MLKIQCILLALVACGPSDDDIDRKFFDIVRERASREFPCEWQHVSVYPLTGYAYEADGCGERRVYECGFESGRFDSTDKTLYVCRAAASEEDDDAGR